MILPILMLIILMLTILMLIILISTISSARLLAATTLRNVLGTMTLGDILCNREAIAKEMKVCFCPEHFPGQIMITLPSIISTLH